MSEPCTDLYARLEAVANAAGLLDSLLPRRDVTLFCQDWGGREPGLELLLTDPICAQRGSETNSPRPAACDTT